MIYNAKIDFTAKLVEFTMRNWYKAYEIFFLVFV